MNIIELIIQRKTESGYPVIVNLTSSSGALPLRRDATLVLDFDALADLVDQRLEYGIVLGKALFIDEMRDTFREGLAENHTLHVNLSIEAPELHSIYWHRLAAPFDGGRWHFLAAQQRTPFSLDVPSPARRDFPEIGHGDLRALILVAGIESLSSRYKMAAFDVPATIHSIQEALGNIPHDVLAEPTLDALCAKLTATPYTILHLVCHGVVNDQQETVLYFPKDSNGSPVRAGELLSRLANVKHIPHFAFICACESALPYNGLGNLAQRLISVLGLPAAVAMTERISILTAQAMTAPFYAQLQKHGQPDLALAEALAGLQGRDDLTVPALFSRLGGRPLFSASLEEVQPVPEAKNQPPAGPQFVTNVFSGGEVGQVVNINSLNELNINNNKGSEKK